ncbi:MAG TPA: hypothetical protein VNJ01_14605 [Bacteriovoracaceae bacterium]|nr:hypothetical protein [Bacteriovoracaceae bacterium]
METSIKIDSLQPRLLKFRTHYKIYIFILLVISCVSSVYWSYRFIQEGAGQVIDQQGYELIITGLFYFVFGNFYFFWLKSRLDHSVQVFPDHIIIHNQKRRDVVTYTEIESVNVVCWSIFYLKMKNGYKHYFNSGLERVDYVWEGIHKARPELFSPQVYEDFRLKLVQYDHHQKRKEWFFRHKLVDGFNWVVLPFAFMTVAYFVQSQEVFINQQGLYFFRLFMYALLVLLINSFCYTMVLKKYVFDQKLLKQLETSSEKFRDIEYEGVVLQRSKLFQMITTAFLLALIVRVDLNLFSVTKVKENMVNFDLVKGTTIVVDNRYNCVACSYNLKDGDLVLFGKGFVGQILAKEGDMVGQIAEDKVGRTIASENVHEVPKAHVAIKAANGKDIMFVKIGDLIGKIKR